MGQWIEIVLGFILWPFIAYFLGRQASRKNRIVYYIYAAAMFLYTVVLACIDIQGWWLDFLRNGALSFTLVVLIRFAYQGGKTESKFLVGWGFSTFMLCVLFFCYSDILQYAVAVEIFRMLFWGMGAAYLQNRWWPLEKK